MAIDKSLVATDIALGIVQQTDILVNALQELKDLQEWRNEADEGEPIDFNDYDSGNGTNPELLGENAENTQLKHIAGATLNKLSGQVLGADETVVDSVMNHLVSTTVSGGPLDGKTYWEVISMIRRNA